MKYALLLLITLPLALSSCRERGCNDPDAINYEDSANRDDGSCRYATKVIFLSSDATQTMIDNGSQYSVQFQGLDYVPHNTSTFDETESCIQHHIEVVLEKKKARTLDYTITQSDSSGVSTSTEAQVTLVANHCHVIEI